MIIKYLSIVWLISFFAFITVVGLKNCDKPSGHTHLHAKPEKKKPKDTVCENGPYVLATDIIFEVFMGENYAK